ncbi:Crp/Fnr family transcriptional regulator [Pararhodobacter sp.]|uniref:Crp/Fnr family transcriptional regulator n=1 Tax=Pararhodobacter sp. TaxID=2127056 RepID=UPI002AFFC47D|nr:Crp/Fnr family transcriptional regulator [Pararhodobacter sp.]
MLRQSTSLEHADGQVHTALVDVFMRAWPRPVIESAGKGTILVNEDDFADHSMLLLDGWVAFSKMLPEGETQIIDVMLPGDFALIGAVNAAVATCSIEALSDVRFIRIRPTQANGPEPEMARLRDLMSAEIVRTQARTSELLLRLGKGRAASRVAYALLEFYVRLEAVGLVTDNGFVFPMTQHKIGEFTGLSNVHVCRTMRRFEREGIISYPTSGDIVLRDIGALCDVADIELKTFKQSVLAHRGR